jgi:hypothetical protein
VWEDGPRVLLTPAVEVPSPIRRYRVALNGMRAAGEDLAAAVEKPGFEVVEAARAPELERGAPAVLKAHLVVLSPRRFAAAHRDARGFLRATHVRGR